MAYPYGNTWNRLRWDQMNLGQSPMQTPQMGVQSQSNPWEDPNEITQIPIRPQQSLNSGVPDVDIAGIYGRYPQRMDMQNRFATEAQNAPNRADFRPDAIQRISAALAGFSGSGPTSHWGGVPVGFKANPNQFEDTQNILDRPFNQAMADYKMRIDPLRAAADDERMANVNQGRMASDEINRSIQENNYRRLVERDRTLGQQGDTRLEQAQQKIDISNARAEIYRLRGEQRELRKDENGYVYGVNKNDPTDVVYAQDDYGNRIKDSQLPERERLLIVQGNRIEAIEATGNQNRQTKGTSPGAAPPTTTTSEDVIRDPQGNVLRSTTRKSTREPSGTRPQSSGNKVVMYDKDGNAGLVRIEDTDQAQADGFTFNNPKTGPDFRPRR